MDEGDLPVRLAASLTVRKVVVMADRGVAFRTLLRWKQYGKGIRQGAKLAVTTGIGKASEKIPESNHAASKAIPAIIAVTFRQPFNATEDLCHDTISKPNRREEMEASRKGTDDRFKERFRKRTTSVPRATVGEWISGFNGAS